MEYRNLGRTGLKVSSLCLGTMTWGSQNSEAEGHAQMDYAVEQGINFFDTAELYPVPPAAETQGLTEKYVGSWFAKRKNRDQIILASKMVGTGLPWIRGGDMPIDKHSLTEALEGNLKRLQTDYIDLYQLHWPNRAHYHFGAVWNFDASKNEAAKEKESFLEILETLAGFIKEGKIRHFGLSNDTAWGVMQYLKLSESHNLPRLASIQNEYNLTCRIFEPDLAEISLMEEVSLLAYSPLSTGAISGKYLNGQIPEGSRRSLKQRHNHRANRIADAAISAYIKVAEKHGLDVCQMALAFGLSRAFMTSVIIGATNLEQLSSNIAAKDLKLSGEVLSDIEAVRRDYPIPY